MLKKMERRKRKKMMEWMMTVPCQIGILVSCVGFTAYFFNLLKMKCRPLYLKTQSVPCSKHILSQL
jgi:hypothetical protein